MKRASGQVDLFAAALAAQVDDIACPFRDDATPIPDVEPCPQMAWPVPGDPWSVPGFDAYGAACLECGLPTRAHWRTAGSLGNAPGARGGPEAAGCLPYCERRDSRWGTPGGADGGRLWYRGACSCGWRAARAHGHESTAFYGALFHVNPSWLDLPVYRGPRHVDNARAQAQRDKTLAELYGDDPMVVLTVFDIHEGSRLLCRGVVEGRPAEVCVHPAHHLRLVGFNDERSGCEPVDDRDGPGRSGGGAGRVGQRGEGPAQRRGPGDR